jgi:hypothetical protein
MTSEKINDAEVTIQRVEAGLALFVCLVSLREEIRARKDTVTRAKCALRSQRVVGSLMQHQQKKPLPRYVERNRTGNLSFRVDRGARIRLPNDPTTPEFRAAYSAALVDAIAAESNSDDWSELEAMHRAQRRGTAKHGGQR